MSPQQHLVSYRRESVGRTKVPSFSLFSLSLSVCSWFLEPVSTSRLQLEPRIGPSQSRYKYLKYELSYHRSPPATGMISCR